ncbi:MAG: peptidase T [Lactimicrobium sp.]|jgi:tripeptide aminopeptidase|uniref:peptidase T n=2 Tax=Lactimicrobium sp. TaxID=2563780 RepID=UPI002F35F3C6
MSALERLIRYCRIDTQSDPDSQTSPSTKKQFDLAKVLLKELQEMGIQDASLDDTCYIYAHLESNLDHESPCVGFIAHMDTAPDYSGTGVNPHVIENYDGKDIDLGNGVVTHIADFPEMASLKGKTLVVTDGTTLLGADDKAGVTAIMEALQYLVSHPEVKHGRIAIAFTPDEEVGRGTEHFDVKKFGADFAYTMDGGDISVYSDETFNAASAVVKCTGLSIHPGSAKNKMVNALNVCVDYHNLLPAYERPEHTEGREPFFHLHRMHGDVDYAEAEYLIRAHESSDFETMKKLMKQAADYINDVYQRPVLTVEISDTYHNMKEVLIKHPEVSDIAVASLKDLGLTPVNESIRGGTDGSNLTFMGVSCPNLGNGGGNCHGRYEYCVVEQLEQSSQLIEQIARRTGEMRK